MATPRDITKTLLTDKIHLEPDNITDLERGIYNWAVRYATEKSITKNWANPVFAQLYIDKARSVISNLDTNSYVGNTDLIQQMNSNAVTPHEIPFMKPQDVFPARWQELVDLKQRRDQQIGELTIKANTDAYRCGRCKGREIVYQEKQLRGADEPMSLILTCLTCYHSWRM